ncbi:hypothetical protein VNI00_016541 [Paramarasmius palmivorus]|uniref:Ribonuclease H1 N-terminal domain-containing protein n=1 Tax=Paramarasmius palmivorus TaxID=297713 RepID=A0AAW0BF38_9AGAR
MPRLIRVHPQQYPLRPASPLDRREGTYVICEPGLQGMAYLVPHVYNSTEHDPEQGITTIRTTMEEVPGLVITTTTTVHRVHPDYPRPARPGPRSVSTVPDSMIVPTEEEEARGYCNRNGNLYLVVPPANNGSNQAEVVNATVTASDVVVERSVSPPLSDGDDEDDDYDVGSISDTISTVSSTSLAETPVAPASTQSIPAPTATSSTPVASSQPVVAPAGTIPHPSTFQAPANVPEGTRYYVVYVGRQLGLFWGDWYQEVKHLVHGVSGHRSTKHNTFEQALVEYTRAFYGQKPGYELRVVGDVPATTSNVVSS